MSISFLFFVFFGFVFCFFFVALMLYRISFLYRKLFYINAISYIGRWQSFTYSFQLRSREHLSVQIWGAWGTAQQHWHIRYWLIDWLIWNWIEYNYNNTYRSIFNCPLSCVFINISFFFFIFIFFMLFICLLSFRANTLGSVSERVFLWTVER